mmetsp:Transcript_10850/g.17378  ORF Transcript_10850/g.17378 Transcript_10850/m.17378 type:complete len:149 (-) Transcript_10850:2579-3025(-)
MSSSDSDKMEKDKDIIISSCSKYKNGDVSYGHTGHVSTSWDNIKNNIGQHLLFIFYGNPNQDDLFEYNKEKKELCIKTSDEYDNIPTKSWLAYCHWFYHMKSKAKCLITFCDDCKLIDEKLFTNSNFNDIDYGGQRIHGPCYLLNYTF